MFMNNGLFKTKEFKTIVVIVLSIIVVFGGAILFAKHKTNKKVSSLITASNISSDVSEKEDNKTTLETTTAEGNTSLGNTTVSNTTSLMTETTSSSKKKTTVSSSKSSYKTTGGTVMTSATSSYKKLNAKMPGVKESDQEILQEMLLHICIFPYVDQPMPHDEKIDWEEYYFRDFDCYTPQAYEYAMGRIFHPYVSLIESMERWYNWPETVKNVRLTQEDWDTHNYCIDPLKMMESYDAGYGMVESKYPDFILKYIFNQTPDHNYILKDYEGRVEVYYYDGNYYFNKSPWGDGSIPKVLFNSCKKLSDGSFLIEAERIYVDNQDGDTVTSHEYCFTVVTKPVEYEGQVYWTLYKIKKNT